jgi:hypothetical protein
MTKPSPPLRAVVLERNKLVGRRIARIWGCAGLQVETLDDPAGLEAALAGAALVAGDAFDAELIVGTLRAHPHLTGAIWTAEPIDRLIKLAASEPRLAHVFGRAGFEVTPRDWELLLVARRLTGGVPPSIVGYLAWGGTGFETPVVTSGDLPRIVGHVQETALGVGAPRRAAEMLGELAHELLMNGLYDAPVDAEGKPRHAHDRKAPVELGVAEAPIVRMGSDGVRIALQVVDPFGRLERRHVFPGIARGLAGTMDRANGGAGLGLTMCHQNTTALFVDVVPGKRTCVTGLFELDLNQREFRQQAKSLHVFGAA